jgi:hypothetical protein
MDLFCRSDRRASSLLLGCVALAATLAAIGCASPGPPRAPSLHLPPPVRDLTVARIGDTVELHFTAPASSTDKLPLRGGTVTGQLCRQLPHQACIAVPSSKATVSIAGPGGTRNPITWTDTLPPDLTDGPAKLLAYRVEFFSPAGRSAGLSEPAFTATGPAPAPVDNLHVDGTRLGILLSWNSSPDAGDVLLHREDLAPKPPKPRKTSTGAAAPKAAKNPAQASAPGNATPGTVWLGAQHPGDAQTSRTLDTAALPDTPYRYFAQRRVILELGSRSIELRSQPSAATTFTLLQKYPPPAPTGFTAVGYVAPASAGTPAAFAVDLIWQPVDEAGLVTPLAGYNLYREPIDGSARRHQLNTAPIPSPAFHDTSASATSSYRYIVTAIDIKGNESPAATVLLQPPTA